MNANVDEEGSKLLREWGSFKPVKGYRPRGVDQLYAFNVISGPCPGCGKTDMRRPADRVCSECIVKIAEHSSVMRSAEQVEGVVVALPFAAHALPHLSYDRCPFDKPRRKSVQDLVYDLTLALSTTADFKADAKMAYPAWPRSDDRSSSSNYWRKINPNILEILRELYVAIRDMSDKAHEKGKEDGSHFLVRLASGDVKMNELNDKSLQNEKD